MSKSDITAVVRELKSLGFKELRTGRHLLLRRGKEKFTIPMGSKYGPIWWNETQMKLKRLRGEAFNEKNAKRREAMMTSTGFTNQPTIRRPGPQVPVSERAAPASPAPAQTGTHSRIQTAAFEKGMNYDQIADVCIRLRDAGMKWNSIQKLITAAGIRTRTGNQVGTQYLNRVTQHRKLELNNLQTMAKEMAERQAREIMDRAGIAATPPPPPPPATIASAWTTTAVEPSSTQTSSSPPPKVEVEAVPARKPLASASEILKMIADICLSNLEEETKLSLILDKARALAQE